MSSPIDKSTALYPRGPLRQVHANAIDKHDEYHFVFDLSATGIFSNETKMGIGLDFFGDIPQFPGYGFTLGYRYSPPITDLKLPHHFNIGGGKKVYWGDYRFGLFCQIPSFTNAKLYKDSWQVGAFTRVSYNLYAYKGFRFGLTAEAGLSTGKPGGLMSHLGVGLLMGFGR
jgi:hypothetical protein